MRVILPATKRFFKVVITSTCLLMIFAILSPLPTYALTTVPTKVNYQGKLATAAGTVVADGTYNMRFKLYTVNTGGSAAWSEDRLISASNGVTVSKGLFSVRLGDITPIPASLFASGDLYFEVELPNTATATTSLPVWTDGPMTPRNQLAASAYSFNSETLDGLDSAAFTQIGANNVLTGSNTFRNTSNSTSAFAIQNSSGVDLLVGDTTNNRIYIGEPVADSAATFLAVDSYNLSADPAGGFNGAIYYNSNTNKLRCFEASAWKDCISSGGGTTPGYTLNIQALSSSPTDSATVYFGALPRAPSTIASGARIYVRKAGTIKIAEIYAGTGTSGTSESWSLYVRLNNTTDTLIATVATGINGRVFSNTALNIPVVSGDYIEIKGVQPLWVTNPTALIYSGYLYIE